MGRHGPGGVYGYFGGNSRALYGARGPEAGGWYGDTAAYRVANNVPDHRPADDARALLDGSGRLVRDLHPDGFERMGSSRSVGGAGSPPGASARVLDAFRSPRLTRPDGSTANLASGAELKAEDRISTAGFTEMSARVQLDDGLIVHVRPGVDATLSEIAAAATKARDSRPPVDAIGSEVKVVYVKGLVVDHAGNGVREGQILEKSDVLKHPPGARPGEIKVAFGGGHEVTYFPGRTWSRSIDAEIEAGRAQRLKEKNEVWISTNDIADLRRS